jgi:hypothetical protein
MTELIQSNITHIGPHTIALLFSFFDNYNPEMFYDLQPGH